MPNYSFQETATFFAERMQTTLPRIATEKEGVSLAFDSIIVSMRPTQQPGGIIFSLSLGLLLHPILEMRISELMTSHFIGVNTGGCTLAFDPPGVVIFLKAVTSPYTPPQENWEWAHRLICVAHEWIKILSLWDEFVPLLHFPSRNVPLRQGKI